jgi:hypothetical protein
MGAPKVFEPSEAFANSVHEIYLALFKSSLAPYPKQRSLECAADGRHTWRIVGISEAALRQICHTGNAKGLKRGHSLDRAARARHVFERPEPLSKTELLDWFFRHDTTTLVTAAENGYEGVAHWSPVIPVPDGILASASFSVRVSRRRDLPWAMAKLAEIDAQKAPASPADVMPRDAHAPAPDFLLAASNL